jgi:hypothetical protein
MPHFREDLARSIEVRQITGDGVREFEIARAVEGESGSEGIILRDCSHDRKPFVQFLRNSGQKAAMRLDGLNITSFKVIFEYACYLHVRLERCVLSSRPSRTSMARRGKNPRYKAVRTPLSCQGDHDMPTQKGMLPADGLPWYCLHCDTRDKRKYEAMASQCRPSAREPRDGPPGVSYPREGLDPAACCRHASLFLFGS